MLTFIIALISSASIYAHAQVPFSPHEGQISASGEFQYLTTSANYNSGGSSTGLFAGGKLTRMLGVFVAAYDYSPAIRVYGGFSGGQTSAVVVDNTNLNPFTTVTKTQTNSGMNEGWLGGQWWSVYNKFEFVPQVDFTIPFWRVNTASANPLLGEGAMRLQGGSWVMYPMEMATPFGYLGLTYQDGGRSMLVPYSIGGRYGNETQWWVQAEFRGFISMTDNSNIDDRNFRDAYLLSSDGGSYEFYSLSPSRHEVAGMLGYNFSGLTVYGGGSKTVFGKNSADDYEIRIGFTWKGSSYKRDKGFSGYAPATSSSSPARAPRPQDESFQEDAVKYDESLFQEQVTPKPKQQQPSESDSDPQYQRPVQPKAKAKAPAKEAPMPNVELLMKDTQKSLEKRKGR